MKRKSSTLSGRYLAASNRSLNQGIARRKAVEEALKKSGEHDKALLEESLALQEHFRRLTHQILTAQEAERKRIGYNLRDEIAQALLGINVRLLTLKKAAKGDTANVKNEIANTRRVVQESVETINQFASELDIAGTGRQVCEAALLEQDPEAFWASVHGTSAISGGPPKRCRVAVSDITPLTEAENAQGRMETLAAANRDLRREIDRRQAVENSLRKSEEHYRRLLGQSRQMQEQLGLLSRQVLATQEEERKEISRELHDVIAQTLTGINVRLAELEKGATSNTRGLERSIARMQRLVQQSVDIVHQFAWKLRPTVLDELGLIPALHTFMKHFRTETGSHQVLVAKEVGDLAQVRTTRV